MTADELREWLRDNLVIDVDPCSMWEKGNSVFVALRFKGEPKPFSREVVYIPEQEPTP
jgi:hypothetical protein